MNLHRLLRARGQPVRAALIGAGKFGSMFLAQVPAIPGLEVAVIADLDQDRARRACATVGWDAPRTAFAAHQYSEAFRILGAHPRLIRPVEQVFGDKLYMHQFKVNAKAAFAGDVWQWHQDYGTWARDDGMPEPRAMNISVFLDEVMPINGPLMLVPRSHTEGVFAAGHDEQTTSYPLWTLDNETVAKLVDAGGIVAPTGKPGGVLMFHGNLVHGSAGNITPYPRKIVYLTLNAVSNHIRKPTRPEWIAHTDFTPIEPVADDAIVQYARRYRQAAE